MQEENSLQKKNYWEVGLLNLSLVVWSKWERQGEEKILKEHQA